MTLTTRNRNVLLSVGQCSFTSHSFAVIYLEAVGRHHKRYAECAAGSLLALMAMADVNGERFLSNPVSQFTATASTDRWREKNHENLERI
ncbi:hypothetical protein ABIB06_007374 [Bradyrhizobium sp. LB8.2]|uniref:hypothetical protein n=1 Tax=unclassified Bradyrhizobium TaxID=2631580 RepID=UPI00339B6760